MSAASSNDLRPLLAEVAAGRTLSESEAEVAFDIIMSGNATPSQMGALLMALRVRGESVDEITGAARTMRAKALTIDAPPGTIDTVGTGGDGVGTFNISTASALVVAGCGVPVAKHGNRAFSSKSGAADVLSALGVNIDADMAVVRRCLWEIGFCFLMAPRHHSAMRHVGPTRVELGTRTIFNLLGPMSNPAGTRRQLVGVFAPEWVVPMAEVLGRLGAERAWVVHGAGIDEMTTAGVTNVAEFNDGRVRSFMVTPEEAGLPRATLDDLKGGEPAHNAALMRDLLGGAPGPLRDVVLLNSAASLVVAGRADDLRAGVALAATALDSGAARGVLDRLVAMTTGGPPVADVLAEICAEKRAHVARRKAARSEPELRALAAAASPLRPFAAALENQVSQGRYGLIAEIKKASPSRGLIRADFDPAALAQAYQAGGATCLSVLTDTPYFQGDDGHLQAARAACDLPVLRKDFILDPYQVLESRALGADCILLIIAALDDRAARELAAAATELGLDVLVEVHDRTELDRALGLDVQLIGINNRDLKTLQVDLQTTKRLAPLVPAGRVIVGESGIGGPADLDRLAAAGAHCFLVGESLMRAGDVAAATRRLLRLPDLTHTDVEGRAHMVDVSDKAETDRVAVAGARVVMQPATLERIRAGEIAKGDVLAVARLAGIMAAKRTAELIPLCHPLALTSVAVELTCVTERSAVEITATCRLKGRTGVEMEALTAAGVAALTIYDMCKAIDRAMVVTDLRLLRKSGGKSEDYEAR